MGQVCACPSTRALRVCYKKNTVTPSRYCMRFLIPTKLSNNLTTGYIPPYFISFVPSHPPPPTPQNRVTSTFPHSMISLSMPTPRRQCSIWWWRYHDGQMPRWRYVPCWLSPWRVALWLQTISGWMSKAMVGGVSQSGDSISI